MPVNVNIATMSPGSVGNSETYNANFQEMISGFTQILEQFGQYMEDMAGSNMGMVSGGDFADAGGLSVSVTAGVAWINKTRVSAPASSAINLNASETNYIYLDSSGDYSVETTSESYTNKILRAQVVTDETSVSSITQYNNEIWTIGEMIEDRISPFGIHVYMDDGTYYVEFCYRDNVYIDHFELEYQDGEGNWITIDDDIEP